MEQAEMRNLEVSFYEEYQSKFGYKDGKQCFMCAVVGMTRFCNGRNRCPSNSPGVCFTCLSTSGCRDKQCVVAKTRQNVSRRCYACLQSTDMHNKDGNVGRDCDRYSEDFLARLVMFMLRRDEKRLRHILHLMNYRGDPITTSEEGLKALATFLDRGVDENVYGKGGTNYMRFAAVWMAIRRKEEQASAGANASRLQKSMGFSKYH